MANMINWFEIPVNDFNRAERFYSSVLGITLTHADMAGTKMGFFPSANDGSVSGAIVKGENYVPSGTGVLVYLNGGENLEAPLAKVEKAGGQVIVPKTHIGPDMGYFAIFADTEGNTLAFHSMK